MKSRKEFFGYFITDEEEKHYENVGPQTSGSIAELDGRISKAYKKGRKVSGHFISEQIMPKNEAQSREKGRNRVDDHERKLQRAGYSAANILNTLPPSEEFDQS